MRERGNMCTIDSSILSITMRMGFFFPTVFPLSGILGHIVFVKDNFGCKVNGHQPKASGRDHISSDRLSKLNDWTHEEGRDDLREKERTVQDSQVWTDASVCSSGVRLSRHHHERDLAGGAGTKGGASHRRWEEAPAMSVLVRQFLTRKVAFEEAMFLLKLSGIIFFTFELWQKYLERQGWEERVRSCPRTQGSH